jgi:hypothetical protein
MQVKSVLSFEIAYHFPIVHEYGVREGNRVSPLLHSRRIAFNGADLSGSREPVWRAPHGP